MVEKSSRFDMQIQDTHNRDLPPGRPWSYGLRLFDIEGKHIEGRILKVDEQGDLAFFAAISNFSRTKTHFRMLFLLDYKQIAFVLDQDVSVTRCADIVGSDRTLNIPIEITSDHLCRDYHDLRIIVSMIIQSGASPAMVTNVSRFVISTGRDNAKRVTVRVDDVVSPNALSYTSMCIEESASNFFTRLAVEGYEASHGVITVTPKEMLTITHIVANTYENVISGVIFDGKLLDIDDSGSSW